MITEMKFSKSKNRILHLGWSNAMYKYKWGEEWLESDPAERDQGRWLAAGQYESKVCELAVKSANHIPGCITV